MAQEKFGRYEIKSEIGRGGMATVYHAYDPRFERDVAIKVLPHAFLHDPQFRVRFDREAKTIALLEHPAIVPVYDFGEESEQPYIVMRYMSGGSLSDRIKQGPLAPEEASQIITRLAPALDAAHARGIIHRDLKPGNILFDQYGNAFLSDFGIARMNTTPGSATLTQGAILGTPAYMSPEQIQGNEIDGRSDLYSLGVILYEMLSGVQPYYSETPGKVMMMHVLEPVPQITKVKADVSPAIDAVIEKSMAKEPALRYPTAAETASALETALHGSADATRMAAQPTHMTPAAGATSISHPPSQSFSRTPTPPPIAATVVSTTPVPLKKRGLPVWALAAGVVLLLGLGAVVILGGVALLANRGGQGQTATATNQIIVVADIPTATQTPLPPARATAAVIGTLEPPATVLPSTATSTVAAVVPTSTLTPTVEVKVPVIGGADKVAFLNANDIWVMNVDGSQLVQLTNDHSEKSNLSWTSDGNSIVYISGKCFKIVDATSGRVDDINCFESADSVTAFEISPDGKQVAIVIDYQLYIVPYNLDALRQVRSRNDLPPMSPCKDNLPLSKVIYEEVRWSSDGTKMAVTFKGVDNARRIDLIRVMDVSKCNSDPPRLDEFPASRFTMSGYNNNPLIYNFSWNGDILFALNSVERNGGFGDLYVYNTNLHKLQTAGGKDAVDPIDGVCCYRSPAWSPDGRYLMFVFQDIRLADKSVIQLYYVPYGNVGTGATFQPINLPNTFFGRPSEDPQPALRPAK